VRIVSTAYVSVSRRDFSRRREAQAVLDYAPTHPTDRRWKDASAPEREAEEAEPMEAEPMEG
jgi:hypothetical protein